MPSQSGANGGTREAGQRRLIARRSHKAGKDSQEKVAAGSRYPSKEDLKGQRRIAEAQIRRCTEADEEKRKSPQRYAQKVEHRTEEDESVP